MIPDRWYPILESSKLRRRPVGVTRMGRKLVLGRDAAGIPGVGARVDSYEAHLNGDRVFTGGELLAEAAHSEASGW